MGTLFSTCLLVGDGSKAPELINREVNLHPGDVFAPDQGENVLIAGAFSSIYQESGILLSPTLLVNHRLAQLSDELLTRVAQAEYDRGNDVDFRSWTVEADNRVCVVSSDVQKIEEFLDTYAGILEISPVLLAGSHPEIPTAIKINVDSRDGECHIDCQLKSVLHLGSCVYCGQCGTVCPEACISAEPHIDLTRCTMCKKCEEICPTGAIDLHGVIERSMVLPALISLDAELPENLSGLSGVYSVSRLDEYFASLFPFKVEETVTWNSGLCHYSARHGRGCDLCLSSCGYSAIAQDKQGVSVDTALCTECGACVAACPTGALQNGRFQDDGFLRYFDAISLEGISRVVLGDEEHLKQLWWRSAGSRFESTFFLEYSPQQGLSLFHYLFLFFRGIRQLVILEEADTLHAAQKKQLELANTLISRLFDLDSFVVCNTPETLSLQADSSESQVNYPVNLLTVTGNRRDALVMILGDLVTASGRQIEMDPKGYIPFATVTCDEAKCTQCMACLNECRVQALHADEQGLSLNHLPARCVGCGLCAAVCPENALSISSAFTFNQTFFTDRQMAAAEPMVCKECGKIFGTKKAYERVMAILSKKESVDTSHFQYCDTCRVVKLFEEQ